MPGSGAVNRLSFVERREKTMKSTTVIITPRDRYSGVVECIEGVYQHTPEPIDLMVSALDRLGIPVVSLRDRGPRATQRTWELLRVLRSGRFDVIHVHSQYALRGMAPILTLLPGRLVYTRHGEHPLRARSWRLIHTWARRFVDVLTFVSQDSLEAAQWRHHGWRQPTFVLENGVDTEVGGNPRLVLHEQTGLLAPPADGARLAEALDRLLRQPAEADHYAHAGPGAHPGGVFPGAHLGALPGDLRGSPPAADTGFLSRRPGGAAAG
jgi:glycosyltransferase involved in cell wall biosynthesis